MDTEHSHLRCSNWSTRSIGTDDICDTIDIIVIFNPGGTLQMPFQGVNFQKSPPRIWPLD